MAFPGTVKTWVAGAVLAASDLNAQIRDIANYFKGRGGAIVIEDTVSVNAGTAGANGIGVAAAADSASRIFLRNDATILFSPGNAASDAFIQRSAAAQLTLATDVIVQGVLAVGGMRAHRHPYASVRHIESGFASSVPSTGASVTFTDAYAFTPNVVASVQDTWTVNNHVSVYSRSTTGFSIKHGDGSSQNVAWFADGAD